jgi:hypothetical protein
MHSDLVLSCWSHCYECIVGVPCIVHSFVYRRYLSELYATISPDSHTNISWFLSQELERYMRKSISCYTSLIIFVQLCRSLWGRSMQWDLWGRYLALQFTTDTFGTGHFGGFFFGHSSCQFCREC